MNEEQLSVILKKHKKWVADEAGGERANLSWSDLRGTNLRGTNLSRANLIVLHIGPYDIYIHAEYTRIGCQYHTNERLTCTLEDAANLESVDNKSLAKSLWAQYGDVVKAAIRVLQESASEEERKEA